MLEEFQKLKPQFNRRKLTTIVVVLLVVAISWSGYVDRQTNNYVHQATVQALAAFATARVLNAGIAVAKSVQVGAVVSVQPLEILDPIHDLVEQYSAVMKLAIGSLIIQKVLIEIVATGFFKILLALLAALLLASLIFAGADHSTLMLKIFAMTCLVRFLLIFAVGLNGLVDTLFVDAKTAQNMVELEVLSEELDALSAGGDQDDPSWHAGIASRFSAAKDLMTFENLKHKAEVAVPAMLNLMALFLLKTLILPLSFLWLLLKGFRVIWRLSFATDPENRAI